METVHAVWQQVFHTWREISSVCYLMQLYGVGVLLWEMTLYIQKTLSRSHWWGGSFPCKSPLIEVSSVLFKHVICRLSRYQQFKDFQKRILVATNLFGRGMDIERVNIVFNYDMPEDSDTYLHRVSFCLCTWLGCVRLMQECYYNVHQYINFCLSSVTFIAKIFWSSFCLHSQSILIRHNLTRAYWYFVEKH